MFPSHDQVGSLTVVAAAVVQPTGVFTTGNLGNLLVWGEVVPGQTPNWSNVSDTQTPNWSSVSDTQTPNWEEVA